MRKTMHSLLLVLLCFLTLSCSCRAHRSALNGRRSSCDNDYGSSATALPIPDPSISWSFSHYLDCTHRAVWISFETDPQQVANNFGFYIGVSTPPLDRFATIRSDALIIGPGLPQLTQEEWDLVPQEVRSDSLLETNPELLGAYFHQSPADQSTCKHLGTVMQEASSVKDGRCDFFEPFGQTNSWRLLDADDNILPVMNATYHVAVFLQNDTSAKIGIALGTWVEDFITPFTLDTPTCTRNDEDFSEKNALQDECFPVVDCATVAASTEPSIGCANNTTGGGGDTVVAVPEPSALCELGQTCNDRNETCIIAGYEYKTPTMGACGGELCPAAVHVWERVNAKMLRDMMDMEYTGNANVDFVRGMIPHHVGAVNMCRALLQNLTCTAIDNVDNLQGLVHFCNHVQLEQDIEVGGMRAWLAQQNLSEHAPCSSTSSTSTMVMATTTQQEQVGIHTGHNTRNLATMNMPESCGNLETPSSQKLVMVNHKMHEQMAIEYSCDHSVDFVRMMLPHHAGAVDMCDILIATTFDVYLQELCSNITLTQRAEIAWMSEWLAARNHTPGAPCQDDDDDDDDCNVSYDDFVPCEDTLSTSSFCHGITGTTWQDGYCRCDNETFAANNFKCDEPTWVKGFGLFLPTVYCKRSCGACPANGTERPLWVPYCPMNADNDDDNDDNGEHNHGHDDDSRGGSAIAGNSSTISRESQALTALPTLLLSRLVRGQCVSWHSL